jgi:FkbH-like protein
VLELRRRGVVIVVCTKNTDEIAREPFRSHPEMLLREEHIAVFQANWDDKATNLNAIAETLDLGLESICFVDDNPAERERVRQELPLVSVPEIGEDPALFPSLIADSGVFEHVLLNADDLGRAASYESNARRVELRTKIGNYDEYLKSLHMTLTLSRFDSVGRPRIAQLINKSNQFNLTTQRYSEEDVKRFEADRAGILCWQARLDDAFGSHGIIGIVIVRTEPKIWTIDTWLMSCRVLMRGVEETLMNLLAERARTAGVEKIVGEYIPTNRNSLVSEFYPKLGFAQVPDDRADGAETYSCKPASWKPLESFIALSISADA